MRQVYELNGVFLQFKDDGSCDIVEADDTDALPFDFSDQRLTRVALETLAGFASKHVDVVEMYHLYRRDAQRNAGQSKSVQSTKAKREATGKKAQAIFNQAILETFGDVDEAVKISVGRLADVADKDPMIRAWSEANFRKNVRLS
ncbi:hypothetical protein [Ruegeria arenilitoris]|uniref:hypothetical protein n=1 Tax=Ruegeria arenilitoris TaxID=1173585 RepID=UPI00147B5908|nr:hypothetical protein [Ruegeria arenilitoris]